MAEHSPSCTGNTLTQRYNFTAFVQSFISDDLWVGYTDYAPEMVSVANIKFVQKLFGYYPAIAIVESLRFT